MVNPASTHGFQLFIFIIMEQNSNDKQNTSTTKQTKWKQEEFSTYISGKLNKLIDMSKVKRKRAYNHKRKIIDYTEQLLSDFTGEYMLFDLTDYNQLVIGSKDAELYEKEAYNVMVSLEKHLANLRQEKTNRVTDFQSIVSETKIEVGAQALALFKNDGELKNEDDNNSKNEDNCVLKARLEELQNDEGLVTPYNWIKSNINLLNETTLRHFTSQYNLQFPNHKIGYEYMRQMLNKVFNITFTRTKMRSDLLLSPMSLLSDYFFFLMISNVVRQDFELVFLDESYFRRVHNSGRRWASKFLEKGVSFTEITRDTCSLILACTRHNILTYRIHETTVGSPKFVDFLKALAAKLKSIKDKRHVIYMDNCRIHKTQEVMDLIKSEGLFVLFGVPYSPQFNLAEFVFSALKQKHYRRVYDTKCLINTEST